MPIFTQATPAADTLAVALSAGRSAALHLAAAVAAPFAALARRDRIRRTTLQLQSLDDRTLGDIGLRRTRIVAIANRAVDFPPSDPRHHAE